MIMNNNLTQKQIGYANDLFNELPQRQAYQNHYNTLNMSLAAIDVEASKLKANPKVALRLAELNDETKGKLVASVGERKERLTEFIREDVLNRFGNPFRNSNIQAIDKLNLMDHVYETGSKTVYNDIKIIVVREPLLKELKDGKERADT